MKTGEIQMNTTWKKMALAGVGTGLALSVAFGYFGTSFAQSATQTSPADQAQSQQNGNGFSISKVFGGMHREGGRHGFSHAVIAEALGMTEDELHTAMQGGKTVADLATEKGVSLDTIINAVIADETTQLAQDVSDGNLTQAEADQRLADLKTNLPDMLSQLPPARGDGMGRGGKMGGPGSPAVIAQALGVTEDELRTAFQDGKSVADVATEKGVSLDTVVNAVIADETTRLAQAVTDGKLTQEQADQRLADLSTNLPDRLSQVPPARGEGVGKGMGGHGRHGGRGGFDQGGTQNGSQNESQQTPDTNSSSSSSSSVAPAQQVQGTDL